MMPIYGRQRLRGTAALQAATDHRCDEGMAIIGRFPGGCPLRRRRELVGRHRGRPYVRLRVRTNNGVKVPIGQNTGCP